MVSESHLATSVSRHVHPAQEQPVLGVCRGSAQFRLHALMVLFVYYVVDAIAVDQQVLLFNNAEQCYRLRNGTNGADKHIRGISVCEFVRVLYAICECMYLLELKFVTFKIILNYLISFSRL